MTKPRFAHNWVTSPRTEELRREIQAIYDALTTSEEEIAGIQWDDVGDKPSEFPPEDHTHVIAEITDFDADDYDTNSDGEYIRFNSGVQICWITLTHTCSGGSDFETTPTQSWPAAFDATPIALVSHQQTSASPVSGRETNAFFYNGSIATTGFRVGMKRATGSYSAGDTIDLFVVAVGLWS